MHAWTGIDTARQKEGGRRKYLRSLKTGHKERQQNYKFVIRDYVCYFKMLCDLLSIYVHRYWPRVLLKVVRSHLDIIEPKLRLVGRREKCDAEDNKPDVCEG